MTEANDAPDADDQGGASEETIFDQPEGSDWLLAYQVGLITDFRVGPSVSVIVGGTMLYGEVVSARSYFEETAKQLGGANVHAHKGGGADSIADTLSKAQAGWGEMFAAPLEPGQEPRNHKIGYLHLKVSQIQQSGHLRHTPNGFYWRIKMSAVDGWSFGSLG